MLSNNSLRGASIEEEKNGSDENRKQDLRNISEERDDPAIPVDVKSRDSKLIDFSPEQVRTEKWMEECLHEQELQYQQLLIQQVQQHQQQQQQQQQHEQNGQSKSEHTNLSPEKQVLFSLGLCHTITTLKMLLC